MQQQQQKQKTISQRLILAAGGPVRVANALGITKGAVNHWRQNNRIPAHYVVDLCHMAKGAFQPHQIRPDVFDAPETVSVVVAV